MPRQNFRVAAAVHINGNLVPATRWAVDINAYSIASTLEATVTTATARGFNKLSDYGQVAQGSNAKTTPLIPMKFSAGVGTDSAPQLLTIEEGYLDATERSYDEYSVSFSGRGAASIFQDIQITTPVLKNAAGSAIIASIFAKRGIPLTVAAPSPQYSGKTQDLQTFDQTMRGRTEWDVLQAISAADGYRLTVHNNQGWYGPYGQGDPTLSFWWGRAKNGAGIVHMTIRHAPRRTRNIKVVGRSFIPKSNHAVTASYPPNAGSSEGETFQVAFPPGLKQAVLATQVQAKFYEIAKKEFLLTATLVPDAEFLQTVSQYGANFKIQLGGPDVWASQQLLYEIRQVRLEFDSTSGGSAPLLAHIIAGNYNPTGEGFVS